MKIIKKIILRLGVIKRWFYFKINIFFDIHLIATSRHLSNKPLLVRYYISAHYCIKGWKNSYNPFNSFYSDEYLFLYPDVKLNGVNPLVHYEKYGKYEGRAMSIADIKPYIPPSNAIDIIKNISNRISYDKNMVVVVASFSKDGKISNHLVYLLEALQQISDYIILIADHPSYEEECSKITNLCNVFIAKRHGEYDFGSYKIGYKYLLDHHILTSTDNLMFINDSNYGPIYPLHYIINDFKEKNCDFYGLSVGRLKQLHIQSFFYIFKSNVYNSDIFKSFLQSIKKEITSAWVIIKYEINFTNYLTRAGFIYKTFVENSDILPNISTLTPTKHGRLLLKDYQFPFIKIKSINGASADNVADILKIIRTSNTKLYNIILDAKQIKQYKYLYLPTRKRIFQQYTIRILELKKLFACTKKLNIVFLVNNASMFPGKSLMDKMLHNNNFKVRIVVIPDTRFGYSNMINLLYETYNELHQEYPSTQMAVKIENNLITQWYDVITDTDIVCYPSPYNLSYSLYNPYYAVQKNILSFHINYGFFRSTYDRIIYKMDNYNNFWKVFLETDINYKEYKKYGQCNGENSVVIGYAKMDTLQQYMGKTKKNEKLCIIIAPHHSIDGGMNKNLLLSNFERYSQFFLQLPKIYPDIDFIFRPHPMLFTVLRKSEHWGKDKVNTYINKLQSYHNMILNTDSNYFKSFAQSDGIIQDCGSFLVEYFYTQKPSCYMLKSKKDIKKKFNSLGRLCLEHSYIGYSEKDIINFINNIIIDKNDSKAEKRKKFAKNIIMKNYPCVSDKIISFLISTFK